MKTLTLSIIIFVLLFGAVALAQDVELPSPGLTPESPFYFLDKLGEALREFFTFSPEGKAHLQIDFAAERIAEIKIILETKGVNARGLAVAQSRLQKHLGDAAEIIVKQKGKGKDVSELAKSISEDFDANKEALKQAFKDQERALEAKEDELKAKMREARRVGDTAQVEALVKELGEIKAQKELLELKEEEQEEALEQEEEKIEREMDKKEDAEKAIKEAEEERQEILDEAAEEGVSVPAEAFEKFDKLLAQAKELFAKENYVGAKQLAKQAEKSLEKVEDVIEDLDEAKEEQEKKLKEQSQPSEQISAGRVKCARSFSPKFDAEPYYTGPLFDAHFHMPISEGLAEEMSKMHGENEPISDPILGKDVTLDKILCFFDKEKVKGTIGFYMVNIASLGDTLEVARNIKEQSSNSIALFLMPVVLDAEKLDSIHKSNAGLFKGYGELAFYDEGMKPLTPSDQKLLDIYNVAEKHGLIVMMHPDIGQKSNIEKALQNNPGVNFLLHGFQAEDYITDLMDRYPNVYFSIDSAVLYPMMGLFVLGPKEQFVSKFKQDFDSILNQKINKWKEKIKKHPDRFMWGTDRGVKWHFDEEIGALFEEFARAFIARLDPAVQENYAYKNAERLLQGQ